MAELFAWADFWKAVRGRLLAARGSGTAAMRERAILAAAAWWPIRGCPGLFHFHEEDLLENGPLTLRLIERLDGA